MAAGKKTPGKRCPDGTLPHELAPGEYSLANNGTVVWLCSPAGDPGMVQAPVWSITIEDDSTITIDPSIWWNKDSVPPGWHGHLVKGEWIEA